MTDRLSLLKNYLAESPDDAFLLFAIAQEYVKAGEDQEALAYFTQLKSMHADYVGLYYHLGVLQLKLGDASSAANTFREGMEVALRSGDQHAFAELNRALIESGEEEI
jgi:tetratricopeptide (TPR) repeat protein